MNAHMIRIVEGPLPGDVLAANDAVFDQPRSRRTNLTLVPAPATGSPAPADDDTDAAKPGSKTDEDDYVLGGYAGI